MNEAMDEFSVTISLTNEGDKNWQRVLEIVYMFINKLKSQDVRDYIYDEIKNKSLIDFNNTTKQKAINLSNSLSRRMNFMRDEDRIDDILKYPYMYENLEKTDIKTRLECMTPDNMIVSYTS